MDNKVRIINETSHKVLAEKAEVASTFLKRLRGLMGRRSLAPGEGIVIRPCSSIHTCLMKFAIDVIFVNRKNRIISVHPLIPPYHLGPINPIAAGAIELPAGTISISGSKPGDYLLLEEVG